MVILRRYCMYRAMAAHVGRFFDFHFELGKHPLQRPGSVWSQGEWDRWDTKAAFANKSDAPFLVIQSNIQRLSTRAIASRVVPFLFDD